MEQCLNMTTVNESRMSVNISENRWVKRNCLFASTKERNTTKVSSCSMFVQTLAAHSSQLRLSLFQSHTHIQGSSSLPMEWRAFRHEFTVCRPGKPAGPARPAGPAGPRGREVTQPQTSGLYFTSPIFFASVSYINSRHILTMKTSASSSRTIATSSRIP